MSDATIAQEAAAKPESTTEGRGHHPDSPSSLQSSEACPLFLNEQRGSSAPSSSGTLCHKACELEDPSVCDTEAEAAAVRRCLDYARRVGRNEVC